MNRAGDPGAIDGILGLVLHWPFRTTGSNATAFLILGKWIEGEWPTA